MERKYLVIKEMTLLSIPEKSGKKVIFHPERNLITGTNDVGKSSLIKSIYHTLGADVEFGPQWEKADVISFVEFQYGGTDYKILRAGGNFGLFDRTGKLIEAYNSIVKGVGPKLADIFDNKLLLQESSSRTRSTVTPAIQFLPFYVDQDASWLKPWVAFNGLGVFTGFKSDLIDFLTGVKPNEYYKLSESIDEANAKLSEMRSELAVLDKAKKSLKSHIPAKHYDIDINNFKKEIDKLLIDLDVIKNKEIEYRNKLIRLKNKEIFADSQIEIAQKSIKEIEKDYQYSLSSIDEGEVHCPTCNTAFENNMISRFGLLEDSEQCRLIINEHLEEKKKIKKEIKKADDLLKNQASKIKKIESLLEEKRSKIKLKDIIDNECSKQVNDVFKKGKSKYASDIGELENTLEADKFSRSKYLNSERKQEIVDSFFGTLGAFLIKLNVRNFFGNENKKVPSSIKDQGSDMPRALLAYYYSILYTMDKYTLLPIFPLVVDSPNQQDQDPENRHKIIKFIFENTPKDYQLILGTVSLHGYKFEGHTIEPVVKYNLLDQDEYNDCYNKIYPFLDKTHSRLTQLDKDIV